jgi:serine protease Do
MEAVRKIRYYLGCFVILSILFMAVGCNLPVLTPVNQKTETPVSTQIPTPEPVQTLVPGLTPSPNPISPDYSTTTISAGSPSGSSLPDYVSVIAKVRPSVVVIHTEVPSFDFFNGTTTQKGAGSGWIIDSKGLIVTNNHVVVGANNITITLEDGRSFTADTVRTDPVTDLAVIKINAPNLPAVGLVDSSTLKVGDLVVAIGNSLDEGISATNGIISAIGVSITTDTGETLFDLIKTNAAINPGNSGGPLVNMEGKVIGITGAKVAQVGVEGSGYAIGTTAAIPIIQELIKTGFILRPWLGVSLYTVDPSAVQALRLAVKSGVLIRQIVAGSPADKAGLKRYDVITSFDGQEVKTMVELVKTLRSHKVGQTVQIAYWRGNNQNTTSVTLEQSPPPNSP